MSDELIQETQQEQVIANAVSPFDNEAWSEQPFVASPVVAEEKVDTPVATVEVPVVEEQKVDTPTPVVGEWYKGYGWDNEELAKAEIEKLRQTKEEIKYANEESEKLHKAIVSGDKKKVLEILTKQDQLEQLAGAEVSLSNAADIVKAAMQYKFNDLTKDELDYKFNKQFNIPSKPAQAADELDEDYQARVSEWEAARRDVEMELMIEAKLAKPELAKLKSEIVIPDTQKQETVATVAQPTQEELEADRKFKESFVQSVQASLSGFKGFDVSVKDKDVDLIPLSYELSAEEKTAVETKLKTFAEKNFDANALFAERWVGQDGKLNVAQMIEDVSTLESRGRMNQKFVNDAANKRLELYLKEKKNINVNETTQRGMGEFTNEKSDMDKVRESAFA
jgi:hypothetical protein